MVPAILGVGILELFDDVTIERVLPGEQIDPHSDDVFDIFVIGMAGDRWVVLRCFEKILFVDLYGLASQFPFPTVNQQE